MLGDLCLDLVDRDATLVRAKDVGENFFHKGDVDRAPRWMQRTGLEWAHRLTTEPRRLAGRYLRHDAPYALRLLATSVRR